MKKKTSVILILFISVVSVVFGILYLTREHLMDYHIDFLGKTEEEISAFNSHVIPLYLALIRICGACFITVGVTACILVSGPFIRKERYAWWSLLVLFSCTLVPMFLVTYHIAESIPDGESKPPFWMPLVMLALLAASLSLFHPFSKK